MDNWSASWSPRSGLIVVGWLLAVVSGTAAVLFGTGGDRPGMLLLGLVALVVAVFSAQLTVLRPKLAADRTGVRVRTIGGTKEWAWGAVQVRLALTRRLGREVPTIELETGTQLLVLGRLELGADPRDVHDELGRFWTA